MKNNMVLTVIIVIVVAAVAFFGGMKYDQMSSPQSQTANFGGFVAGQNGGQRAGNGRFAGNGRAQLGQVLSIDENGNSLVLKLQDGSSKIVNLSSQTRVVKTATASISDVQTGNEIAVFGTTNSDGSITATNIQLNPGSEMRNGQGGQSGPQGTTGGQPTLQTTIQPPAEC